MSSKKVLAHEVEESGPEFFDYLMEHGKATTSQIKAETGLRVPVIKACARKLYVCGIISIRTSDDQEQRYQDDEYSFIPGAM